jgi:GntR family transcriptional regulator
LIQIELIEEIQALDRPLLDRQSAIPLYYQIQQYLLDRIRSGVYRPGQVIPSEQEICAQFGVSRMTARQALKALCDMGLVYSQRGKGTFVSAHKLEKDFRQVLSFSEEMGVRGSRPASRVVSFEIVPADAKVAEALRLDSGADVISLKRVRLADDSPLGLEHSRIPLALCPDLLQTFDPRNSLYQTLVARYGIHIVVTDEVAEASLARVEDAKLLEIPPHSPVFLLTRHSFIENGQPVEYVTSVYRGDRYKIVSRLAAKSQAG